MTDLEYLKDMLEKLRITARLLTHEEYISAGVHLGMMLGKLSIEIEKLDKESKDA